MILHKKIAVKDSLIINFVYSVILISKEELSPTATTDHNKKLLTEY